MTPAERPSVYTVGHSTRSIAEFVELLQQGQVDLVVDIRSTPRSRTNPQFNLDVLPEALAVWQIGYARIAELGGRRPKSKIVSPEVNGFWTNQSFPQLRGLRAVRRVSGRIFSPNQDEQ
jgi:uncharacterized protein (DUF488 family)